MFKTVCKQRYWAGRTSGIPMALYPLHLWVRARRHRRRRRAVIDLQIRARCATAPDRHAIFTQNNSNSTFQTSSTINKLDSLTAWAIM